ncbi:alpha/beta hydrolase [Rhodococcus sp. NPDC058521]|uniref:alpha/beta hydrolase n=1 Tax=Rhodococcus sp. NPDC058521 TaxID=3346536 RepID=UPI00365CB6F8
MPTFKRVLAGLSSAVLLGSMGLTSGAALSSADPRPVPNLPGQPLMVDTDITFDSDGHTFHGTYRGPADPSIAPAASALLLPGSGPIDRNGASGPEYRAETIARLADALGSRGIATLRFDKYGTGSTGTDGPPEQAMTEYGFEQQVDDASSALAELKKLSGTEPQHTSILGHSEGSLTALAVSERRPDAVGGLGLLQPLAMRYLDLIRAQVHAYVGRTVAAGEMEQAEGDAVLSSLEEAIDSMRTKGVVPDELHPLLPQVGISPATARFFSEADKYDPRELAAAVPESSHTLLSCSDKDLNVNCEQVEGLRAALDHTDLEFVHMTTSNHGLGELGPVPPTQLDSVAPLPLAFEFVGPLNAWADGVLEP